MHYTCGNTIFNYLTLQVPHGSSWVDPSWNIAYLVGITYPVPFSCTLLMQCCLKKDTFTLSFAIHQSLWTQLWTVIWDIWSGIIPRRWNPTSSISLISIKWSKVELRLLDNSAKVTLCWTWLMKRFSSVGVTKLSREHGALGGRGGGWILAPNGVMSMLWSLGFKRRSLKRPSQAWLMTGIHSWISANEDAQVKRKIFWNEVHFVCFWNPDQFEDWHQFEMHSLEIEPKLFQVLRPEALQVFIGGQSRMEASEFTWGFGLYYCLGASIILEPLSLSINKRISPSVLPFACCCMFYQSYIVLRTLLNAIVEVHSLNSNLL